MSLDADPAGETSNVTSRQFRGAVLPIGGGRVVPARRAMPVRHFLAMAVNLTVSQSPGFLIAASVVPREGLGTKTHRWTRTPVRGTGSGEASGERNRRGNELAARQRGRRLIDSPGVGAECPTDGRHSIPCRNTAQPMIPIVVSGSVLRSLRGVFS